MFGDWRADCSFSTCVDSALAGSHAWASFFSAPVSFPDSGQATATTISQNTKTAHLVRRPPGKRSRARALLIFSSRSLGSPVKVSPRAKSSSRGQEQVISRLAEGLQALFGRDAGSTSARTPDQPAALRRVTVLARRGRSRYAHTSPQTKASDKMAALTEARVPIDRRVA